MADTKAHPKKTTGGTKSHAERRKRHIEMPSEVSEQIGWFDKFAQFAASVASRAVFFSFCVLVIVLWAPTIFLMKFDTSQLLINTTTTIITFLMVALIQNSQSRSEQAVHHKLNAIADSLADHMLNPKGDMKKAEKDVAELRKAVGLEYIESSDES